MSDLRESIILQLLVAEITHLWPQFASAEESDLDDIAWLTEQVYQRVRYEAVNLRIDQRRDLLVSTIRAVKAEALR